MDFDENKSKENVSAVIIIKYLDEICKQGLNEKKNKHLFISMKLSSQAHV